MKILSFLTSAVCGGDNLDARGPLPPREEPPVPIKYEDWLGPKALPVPVIETRFLGHPALNIPSTLSRSLLRGMHITELSVAESVGLYTG
jgi:hypothetical protein